GTDVEYRQNGNLRLALEADDMPVIQQVIENGNAAGIPMEKLDRNQVHDFAPIITDRVIGASFCPSDGHANNVLAVEAYATAAIRAGATITTGTEVTELLRNGDRVTGVRTSGGNLHADVVIVAAGIYTPRL